MGCNSPHGCSLDSHELVERIADWREVSSQAISRIVETDRIVSTYGSDPQLASRLRQLIAAEAECCSFLKFTMTEGEQETVVELTFPAEARPLVEGVLGAPVGL